MNTQETEVSGILSKQQFDESIKLFSKQFGDPRRSDRLSIQFTDPSGNNVDTRIRLTKSELELMQKTGSWHNKTRTETTV